MKSVWNLIVSIFQLIVGISAIICYIFIAISGENMIKWTITLILAIGFLVMGIVGIIEWIKLKNK